jgi:MFS transporter, DHA3 family, macrolide efflux protein
MINEKMETRKFLILWQGQLVSIIGSGLTSFALGVWVYQKTGLVTLYGMIILMATLPGILIKPLAGLIADKFNRRTVILLSDLGSGLGILFIAIMIWTKHFEIWQIYLGVGFSSLCNGIQVPAYQAAITQLVPKDFYAQASGMMQGASSAYFLVSPILGSLLIGIIGINGIILFDFVTFLYAVGSIMWIEIPLPEKHDEGDITQGTVLTQILGGLKYLKERIGLLVLLIVLFVNNFLFGFLIVLIGPMILSFSTPEMLGLGESISAVGMLVSSIAVVIYGAPKRIIKWLFSFLLISGISYGLIGVRPSFYSIVIPCFIFFLSLPFINVCIDTLLRKKVAHDLQGRVFALTGMITQIGVVLSYIVAGPIADKIFEPLFANGGLLVGNIGRIIGVGKGRGIGFIFIITGLTVVAVSLIAYSIPRVKLLEVELSDVNDKKEVSNNNLSF